MVGQFFKQFLKISCSLALCLSFLISSVDAIESISTKSAPTKAITTKAKVVKKPTYAPREGVVDFSYQDVSPLKLVENPESFKDKKISFSGVFNSFD